MKQGSKNNSALVKKSDSNKSHKKLVLKVLNRYAQNHEKHTSSTVISIRRSKENKVTTVKGPFSRKE